MRSSEALDLRGLINSPRIGVTAALREETESIAQNPEGRFVRTDLEYVKGVSEAGGVPVILPPSFSLRAAEALLDGLDGLLLSGGPDLDPEYYGEEPMPELGTTIPEWDALEMALLRLALKRGIPIFGICRGMQILNGALEAVREGSSTGKSPQHQAAHHRIDHGLATLAQPLVVLAQAPALREPTNGSLPHPAPR
jgi:gamma-glutamyl-gamma-aminobutyrate hydrolase PuuD